MKSANTLFHYTKSLDNLKNIIQHGIFVRYSLESFDNLIEGQSKVLFPMACFCDIKLNNVSDHVKKYGSYSIGLSKNWGKENKLSPVIYSHDNSYTSIMLNTMNENLDEFLDIEFDEPKNLSQVLDMADQNEIDNEQLFYNLKELRNTFSHLIKFIKPYEGEGYSNGKKIGQIKFYDEREWRYIPSKELLKKIQIKDSYNEGFYSDPVKRRRINMKLARHKKLTFTPGDIRFIIVKEFKEIPLMIDYLYDIFQDKKNKGKVVPEDELKLLTSKCISLDQILEDF